MSIVSVLREGFSELGRMIARARLRREMAATDRTKVQRLREVGQKVWEERAGDQIPAGMAEALTRLEESAAALAPQLARLEERRKALEAQAAARQAELTSRQRDVEARKSAPGDVQALHAELEAVARERKNATAEANAALAAIRKEQSALGKQLDELNAERDRHFEEIGRRVAAGGSPAPSLASLLQSVQEADTARGALRTRYAALQAQSQAMPRFTMMKFTGLMLAGVLAVSTFAYASGQLFKIGPEGIAPEDCARRMLYGPEPQRVKAHPGGPYEVVRAETLQLDGSRSEGKCLTYKWAFVPVRGECEWGSDPQARKEGVKPTVVLLCSMDITLTVTDGVTQDSKTVRATVTPRDWETKIEKQIEDVYLPSNLVYPCLACDFGRNSCAFDGARTFELGEPSGHYIHRDSDRATWEGEGGYTLAQVDDPGGPFHSWWYPDVNNLRVQRAALVSKDLHKESDLYKTNIAKGFPNIEALRGAVAAHERVHGDLIREALEKDRRRHDPAPKVETAYGETQEAAQSLADGFIIEAETYIRQETAEARVNERVKKMGFNRRGVVLLRDGSGGYRRYEIPNLATVGD